MKILITEDDPSLQRALQLYLIRKEIKGDSL